MDYKILMVLGLLSFSNFSSAFEPITTATITYGKIIYQYYRAYKDGEQYMSDAEKKRQKDMICTNVIEDLPRLPGQDRVDELNAINNCQKDFNHLQIYDPPTIFNLFNIRAAYKCNKIREEVCDEEIIKISAEQEQKKGN